MNTGNLPHACPEPELLAAFIDKRLSLAEDNRMLEHLAACDTCGKWLANTVQTANALPEGFKPREPTEPLLSRRAVLAAAFVAFAASAYVVFFT